jgi:OCT family organic cation transporter-like MFS transporter 4/5
MIILTIANITCAIVYYGIAYNAKNLSGSPYMNMFYFGIFDFVASPAPLLLNNWIGRRKTFMLYMGLGTSFIVALLLLDLSVGLASHPTAVTVLSLCGRFGIVAAWGGNNTILKRTVVSL